MDLGIYELNFSDTFPLQRSELCPFFTATLLCNRNDVPFTVFARPLLLDDIFRPSVLSNHNTMLSLHLLRRHTSDNFAIVLLIFDFFVGEQLTLFKKQLRHPSKWVLWANGFFLSFFTGCACVDCVSDDWDACLRCGNRRRCACVRSIASGDLLYYVQWMCNCVSRSNTCVIVLICAVGSHLCAHTLLDSSQLVLSRRSSRHCVSWLFLSSLRPLLFSLPSASQQYSNPITNANQCCWAQRVSCHPSHKTSSALFLPIRNLCFSRWHNALGQLFVCM